MTESSWLGHPLSFEMCGIPMGLAVGKHLVPSAQMPEDVAGEQRGGV